MLPMLEELIIYLKEKIGTKKLKSMPLDQCPYQINDKCGIYRYRFFSESY